MVNTVIGFLFDHFFEAIAVWLTALFSKKLIADMGKDRADIIENAIATAMYWAEENFGIGTGELKWEKAWRKIRELLKAKNIVLTESEEKNAQVYMESLVPEINSTTYSALDPAEVVNRNKAVRPKQFEEALDYLRKKYVSNTKGVDDECDPD